MALLSRYVIEAPAVMRDRPSPQRFAEMHRIAPEAWQKGACGIGVLARLDGQPSRRILEDAIVAHGCLTHRGAETHRSPDDPGTSDGAGMMFLYNRNGALQGFLSQVFDQPIPYGDPCPWAVAQFFNSPDPERAETMQRIVERACDEYSLIILGWRDVPCREDILGHLARETMPRIQQLLIENPDRGRPTARRPHPDRFAIILYRIRRQIEQEAKRLGIHEFHVCSMSPYTVVYKGLFRASQIGDFYQADLGHPDFQVAAVMYHQRYATNTPWFWSNAQPFSLIGHNGEINTLSGNRNWTRARLASLRGRRARLFADLLTDGSDSYQLNAVLEAITHCGVDPISALLGLIPEAWESRLGMADGLRAWYRLQHALREPWDGPAGLIYLDGRYAIAHEDRNGYRPLRYVETKDGLFHLSSEIGALEIAAAEITNSIQLGPGEIVALDLDEGRIYPDIELKSSLGGRRKWVAIAEQRIIPAGTDPYPRPSLDPDRFTRLLIAFGANSDEREYFVLPMLRTGKEATFSMGDDTPIAPLVVERPRSLTRYARRRHAQVTNPSVDPHNEAYVFSTRVTLGKLYGYFAPESTLWEHDTRVIELEDPVLSGPRFAWLCNQERIATLSVTYPADEGTVGARVRLEELKREACEAAEQGCRVIILTDRDVDAERARVDMLLAVSGVHQALNRAGVRPQVGLVADTGMARLEHDIACLIGCGADAVHPWLALEWVQRLCEESDELKNDPDGERYRHTLVHGLKRIMATLGICVASSYNAAQLFDMIGLDKAVMEEFFPDMTSFGEGVSLDDLLGDVLAMHHEAFDPVETPELTEHGYVRYRRGKERHANSPEVFVPLTRKILTTTPLEEERYAKLLAQHAGPREFIEGFLEVLSGYEEYRKWAEAIGNRLPITVADTFRIASDRPPIPLEEVEPEWRILMDLDGQGRVLGGDMSFGSISDVAHRDMAIAFNLVGSTIGTGEGGIPAYRLKPLPTGEEPNPQSHQFASGRFGVTPAYLRKCRVINIKIAQGAKPGMGGLLPGRKVVPIIAEVRHVDVGTELQSPFNNEDIYSIEDLNAVIYKLRQLNPAARIAVKIVSVSGAAMVAAGIVKAGADLVWMAGHSGGTGASPLDTIKYGGLPVEYGVQLSHQVLADSGLRAQAKLVADGGIQTGLHAVKMFLLGADAVGLGTIVMQTVGCVQQRVCHLGACTVGVATQRKDLIAKYQGKAIYALKFLLFFAREIREHLAAMGYRSVREIIGRTDLLQERQDLPAAMQHIHFTDLLQRPLAHGELSFRHFPVNRLNQRLLEDAAPALDPQNPGPVEVHYAIHNTDRAFGATLAGELALRKERDGQRFPIKIHLTGHAGNGLGFGIHSGMQIFLEGFANDAVGDSMADGGLIVIKPPPDLACPANKAAIVGMSSGYGATGGEMYVRGKAALRFMVRNSGATAVVEGVGDDACEYMTRGTVVILAEDVEDIGWNCAGGMRSGVLYLLNGFKAYRDGRLNTESVKVEPLSAEDEPHLRRLIENHQRLTGSEIAARILANWEFYTRHEFAKVTSIIERARVDD
jgi:glutamate synthase domain-containing protein 2/glutamate synthase domain-containing protein 1/glutamate synthase domain-containing protein 3